MKYTAAYTSEDGVTQCYGVFGTWAAAERAAARMDADLQPHRDPSGGGAGRCEAVAIYSLSEWETQD